MRASVDLFALRLVGYHKLRNYYGAWEEWGNRDELPIATKKSPGPRIVTVEASFRPSGPGDF